MNRSLSICILAAIASMYVLPVFAENSAKATPTTLLEAITMGKPMTSFRYRYETVEQEAFQPAPNAAKKLDTAHAHTLRSLIGWQTAPFNNFSFAAQITDVRAFNDDYNDRRDNLSEPGNSNYANIVDPGYTDFNQLFVDWTGIKDTKLRLGRQVVNIDNVRFIGDIAFRQNTQVFDGISVFNKSIPKTEIFAALFDRVRQVNTALRDANIGIFNAKYNISPTESLSGYGYFVDAANLGQNGQPVGGPNVAGSVISGGNGLGVSQDLNRAATTDASSRTLGVRLNGVHEFNPDRTGAYTKICPNPSFTCYVNNPDWKVLYTAEYAKQDDYRGGSPLIDAHYFKLGGGMAYGTWSLRIDREKLSSNNGKYGFQTPFGTNHLFQGWSDHFLTTPRQGMEDTFVTLNGSIGKVQLYAEYHVFKSDVKFQSMNGKLGNEYGTELNGHVIYPFTKKAWGKIEYAKFMEDDVYGGNLTGPARKGDKEILWVTTQYTF